MERDHGAGRSGLAQGDIGDGSGSAHDANASLATAGEGGDAVDDITAVGDFHDVSFERVGAVARDDDWGFGLVLGSRGSSARSSRHLGFAGATTSSFLSVTVVAVGGSVFFTFSFVSHV